MREPFAERIDDGMRRLSRGAVHRGREDPASAQRLGVEPALEVDLRTLPGVDRLIEVLERRRIAFGTAPDPVAPVRADHAGVRRERRFAVLVPEDLDHERRLHTRVRDRRA